MTDNQIISNAKLEIIKASDITPKEVRWLWYPYIPFGKVTLLQGDPGDGKSKLMLSLAALLSKPNTILGIEYCKALNRLKSSLKPVTLKRQGMGYHDTLTVASSAHAVSAAQRANRGRTRGRSCPASGTP